MTTKKNQNTDLSIIILNWNTKKLLLECINSILQYTKGIKYEIIVCDNSSTDDSSEIVKKQFKNKIKLIQNPANLGFSAGNNPGLKIAQGKYLVLLNTDTKIDYHLFLKLITWMDQHPRVGILGPQRLNRDGSIQTNGVGHLPSLTGILCNLTFPFHAIPFINHYLPALHIRYPSFYQTTKPVGWVTGSCFLIRKQLYDQIGGLDEHFFMYVEEVEYCKRAADAGWQIWYMADEYLWHLERGSSTSGKTNAIIGVYQGLKYYFQKHQPAWQLPILILFLKFGALLRLPLNPQTYWQAWKSI